MLIATDDTLWFSNGAYITAYTGGFGEGITETVRLNYGAIKGTATVFDSSTAGLEGVTGKVVVVTTTQGVCMLMNGAQVKNISAGIFAVPIAEKGAAGIIETKGYQRYITNLQQVSQAYNQY